MIRRLVLRQQDNKSENAETKAHERLVLIGDVLEARHHH